MAPLIDALLSVGLAPHKPLKLRSDGKIERFRVEGDKAGSLNGWIVYRDGNAPSASFGSWKTGEIHHWAARDWSQLSPAEREAAQRQRKEAQALHDAERKAVQDAAQAKAQRLLARARPAFDSHPYLKRKGVHAFGLRQLGEALLMPIRDVDGELCSLQFIYPDGSKRFLTGGRLRGCYTPLGRPQGVLLVAEGYATAATVHQATGHACAVAFSAANLLPVAVALRNKFPQVCMVIAADNDAHTPGNPGLTAANEAARAVGGAVALPRFDGVHATQIRGAPAHE